MPTQIEVFYDYKRQYEELVKIIDTANKSGGVEGLEIKLGRFPNGTPPTCLPFILIAARGRILDVLSDAEKLLKAKMHEAALNARREAQEIISTVENPE